jgi:hypothetical protein
MIPPTVAYLFKGVVGPTGASGPIGPTGPGNGPSGPSGPTGASGATGATGAIGGTGPTGAQGPTGPQGAQGIQGPQGDIGMPGATGTIGPSGPAGATGPLGPQGLVGSSGATGSTGPIGPTGPAGGATGATGPEGPTGQTGPAPLMTGVAGQIGITSVGGTYQFSLANDITGPSSVTAKRFPLSTATLTYGPTSVIDFIQGDAQTVTLTGDTIFATANIQQGQSVLIRVIAGASSRNLTFPAGWTWLPSSVGAPTSIGAGKTAQLAIMAWTSLDSGIVAAWVV